MSKRKRLIKRTAIMYIVFLFVLLSGLFAGCGVREPEALSAEQIAELQEVWQKKNDNKFFWNDEEYYGSFNGAIVFRQTSDLGAIGRFTVAGQEFYWPQEFTIYVYKNGEFFILEDAYAEGIVSKKNVKTIAERHEEHFYKEYDHPYPTKK